MTQPAPMAPHLAAVVAAAIRPEGAAAMGPDELRAILEALGWSQRFAGELTIGERRLRGMAAGREPIPARLAAWLRLLAAFPPPRDAD